MTAVLILTFSVLALLQFAISQWRMIWLMTGNQPLSDSLHQATGIDAETIGPNDFGKLLGLCELSPRLQKDTPWLHEVKGYYRMVERLAVISRSIPAISAWASGKMKTCSRYVAVLLDQNLSLHLDPRAAVRSI